MKITRRHLRGIIREALEQRAHFITDFGSSLPIEQTGDALDLDFTSLPRYAVWGNEGVGKLEVIDNGDDLEALLTKHGLTPDKVRSL